jgi:hypothetical protein
MCKFHVHSLLSSIYQKFKEMMFIKSEPRTWIDGAAGDPIEMGQKTGASGCHLCVDKQNGPFQRIEVVADIRSINTSSSHQ